MRSVVDRLDGVVGVEEGRRVVPRGPAVSQGLGVEGGSQIGRWREGGSCEEGVRWEGPRW